MVTVSEDMYDVGLSYEEGCDAYCVKPVTRSKIAQLFRDLELKE